LICGTPDQGRSGRQKLDLATIVVPYPANGERAGVVTFGFGPGVIRRDQSSYPLGAARIDRLPLVRLRCPGVRAPRDFRDPVCVNFVQPVPS
jgi:hypothetical protein